MTVNGRELGGEPVKLSPDSISDDGFLIKIPQQILLTSASAPESQDSDPELNEVRITVVEGTLAVSLFELRVYVEPEVAESSEPLRQQRTASF